MIKSNKKYDNLITFGCSFTTGHLLGDEGSWGYSLAKKLNCNHVNRGGGGSNTNMMTNIINYCENHDMTNSCIGVQWSEVTRREYWDDNNNRYNTLGLGTFDPQHKVLERETSYYDSLTFIKNNYPFFGSMWFNLAENLLRTIVAMITVKSYLKNKNIDFIMFEGINTIKKVNKSFYPENYQTIVNHYGASQGNDFTLLKDEVKESILNDITFYSELGDWMNAMYKHPNFDTSINDGHPHQEIVEWWTNNLYEHIKKHEN